jgi:hypothetical protein
MFVVFRGRDALNGRPGRREWSNGGQSLVEQRCWRRRHMTQSPITIEADARDAEIARLEAKGYTVLDIYNPRNRLSEQLAPKVALLKAVFGIDDSGRLTRPPPPKAFGQQVFEYIMGGKVRERRQPLPAVSPPPSDGLRTTAARGNASAAAAILGLKPRKLQSMSQRGEIPGAAKLRRQWTYDLAKLRRFVEQQEKATTCRRSARRPTDATGAVKSYGPRLRSAGSGSGGRLKQMIRESQRRVAKRAKRGQ